MLSTKPPSSSNFNEQTITIPTTDNRLTINLSKHSFVTIVADDQEIVTNHTPAPSVSFSLEPGTYQIRSDGVIESATSETVQRTPSLPELAAQGKLAVLRLTSDARVRNVVDGVAEIPSDGASFAVVTIQKTDTDGTPLTGGKDRDKVFLRATGGFLLDEKGESRVRQLQLVKGRAAFRLLSEKNPKVVTVWAFGRDPILCRSSIDIEFV